jgi:hypothetical protein
MGVDADFAEQALHAEGAGLVGHDGNDIAPDFLVRQQLGHRWTMAMVVATSRSPEPFDKFGVQGFGRRSEDGHRHTARRQIAAQRPPPFFQVADLFAFVVGPVKGGVLDLVIGDGDAEAAAEMAQLLFVELFLLVGDIAPFPASPRP